MKRPILNEIELDLPGIISRKKDFKFIITMSVDQWDGLLSVAYDRGHILLELDDDEKPIKAYQRKPEVN